MEMVSSGFVIVGKVASFVVMLEDLCYGRIFVYYVGLVASLLRVWSYGAQGSFGLLVITSIADIEMV